MKSLETYIDIATPPETVWQVLLDFARYPEWNPFILKLEGPAEVGGKLHEVVAMPNGKRFTFATIILEMEEPRKLVWRGVVGAPFLFTGTHTMRFESLPDGGTRYIQEEVYTGWMA